MERAEETELFADPARYRADLGLLNRAVRQRWPISRSMRKTALQRLERIITECRFDQVAVAAIRALATIDAVNVRRESLAAAEHRPAVAIGVAIGATPSPDPVAVVERLLQSPEYLDWLESTADARFQPPPRIDANERPAVETENRPGDVLESPAGR